MSRLRDASVAFARKGAHPLLSVERLLATERVAAGLEARRIGQAEPWAELVARLTPENVASLPAADLRRLVAGLWTDRVAAHLADAVVERAVALHRRGIDRALVEAYLFHYPTDHQAFATLRGAACSVAGEHDWRWRAAGERWRLWDGPNEFGAALGQTDDPSALLAQAGLVGRLAGGAFVSAARADAARSAR